MAKRGAPRFSSADPLLDSEPAATIDLHGLSADAARHTLMTGFPVLRRQHGGGVVHIITGKGRGSTVGPVLKPLVRQLLKGALSGFISDSTEDTSGGGYRVKLRY